MYHEHGDTPETRKCWGADTDGVGSESVVLLAAFTFLALSLRFGHVPHAPGQVVFQLFRPDCVFLRKLHTVGCT